ncbi:MAG: DUF4019 domain-containing protein [Terriglobales bacterium]|jgi:uncharacterized protein DUF4019
MNGETRQVKFKLMPGVLTIVTLLAIGSAALAQQKPEQLAQQSAATWLAFVDSENYARSWQEASWTFKVAVSQEQWQRALQVSREPLGKLVSRKLRSANYKTTLPGAPDGEYVVLKYDSSFEHKQSAVETVTPTLDRDGKWRVSGYYIK